MPKLKKHEIAREINETLIAQPDNEYSTRIDADRCTWQFNAPLSRVINDFADAPLFGGDRQGGMFDAQ